MAKLLITKASGEREPFSFKKVFRSAQRAGADQEEARAIAEMIEARVTPGMKTSAIYEQIVKYLSGRCPRAAIRFSLKEGIRKLGPTGYPFERYAQSIFARNGFETEAAQFVSGQCVEHEIDFLAYREKIRDKDTCEVDAKGRSFDPKSASSEVEEAGSLFLGECKFHQKPGRKVDLEVALSHQARFLDIQKGPLTEKKKFNHLTFRPILVTNTKFTTQAVAYAQCVGMDLLGWRYPKGKSLEYLVERKRLYPITVLPSLKKEWAELLIEGGIVLTEDLLESKPQKISRDLGIPLNVLEQLVKEARLLG